MRAVHRRIAALTNRLDEGKEIVLPDGNLYDHDDCAVVCSGGFEARQAESIHRSDRFKEASGVPARDRVRDETRIEVSKGLAVEYE